MMQLDPKQLYKTSLASEQEFEVCIVWSVRNNHHNALELDDLSVF